LEKKELKSFKMEEKGIGEIENPRKGRKVLKGPIPWKKVNWEE